MNTSRINRHSVVCCMVVVIAYNGVAHAGDAVESPRKQADATAKQGRAAIERGLSFLQADAIKWRKERECATCHHGTMTVWALSEAKSQGFPVDAAPTDFTKWTKERLKDIDKPRDTRPGWSMVNSVALNLAVMAQAIPKQDAITPDELKKIAGHLLRHQEKDGSWAWSSAPAANRPPPFFESDEIATMFGYMALGPHVATDAKVSSPERDARKNAADWLAKNKPNDTTQAAAYRLLMKARGGIAQADLNKDIDAFLSLQNKDGGWSQVKDRPSDAYATGQALYILNIAGTKNDRAEIRRGMAFLVSTQKDDGSWPMIRRGHEGVKPGPFIVPITYFGSAWGTLGLLRAAPKD
jgi:Squalene-hopene cyclase N-terminal domain